MLLLPNIVIPPPRAMCAFLHHLVACCRCQGRRRRPSFICTTSRPARPSDSRHSRGFNMSLLSSKLFLLLASTLIILVPIASISCFQHMPTMANANQLFVSAATLPSAGHLLHFQQHQFSAGQPLQNQNQFHHQLQNQFQFPPTPTPPQPQLNPTFLQRPNQNYQIGAPQQHQPNLMQKQAILSRRHEQQQQQQQQQQQMLQFSPRPAKLLADYVTYQGQRILKNLVNTSIADLVAQSTTRINQANAQNNQNRPIISPFPSMGKLYTLLFPTQSPTIAPSTAATQTNSSIAQLDENNFNSNNNQTQQEQLTSEEKEEPNVDMYLPAEGRQREKKEELNDEGKIINLSAPYDTRPRSSTLAGWSSKRPQSVDSMESTSNGLDQETSNLMYGQSLEAVGDEVASSELGLRATAEMVGNDAAESTMGAFETSADQLAEAAGQEEAADESQGKPFRGEPPDVYSTSGSSVVNSAEAVVAQMNQQQPSEHYFTYPQQSRGPQFKLEEAQQQHEVDVNNQTGHLVMQEHHQQQHQQQHQQPSELTYMESHQQQQAPSDEESQLQQSSGQQQQHELQMQVDDMPSGKLSNDSLSSVSLASSADESLFGAQHLPSQYESALRPPPDGYYDEYYKPSSSSQQVAHLQLSANSTGSDTLDHEHQQHFSAAHYDTIDNSTSRSYMAKPSLDFSKQYYHQLHQDQPQQQAEMEYMPSAMNNSLQNADVHYEIQHIYTSNNSSSPLVESINAPHRLLVGNLTMANPRFSQANSSITRQQPIVASNEDTIQLIIANTAHNVRDPQSKEKVINYTSEGHNMTRMAGKSPRNNFINKEMNEFPPDGPTPVSVVPATIYSSAASNRPPNPDSSGQQFVVGGLLTQTGMGGEPYVRQFSPQLVPNPTRPMPNVVLLHHTEPKTSPQMVEVVEEPVIDHTRRAMHGRFVAATGEFQHPRPLLMNKEQHHLEQVHSHSHPNEQRETVMELEASGTTGRPQVMVHQASSQHQQRRSSKGHSQHNGKRDKRARRGKQQKQTRAQVTQVNYGPNDLILSPPTPPPDNGPLESVVELPSKVKRLRANQPDKNELMNELLTALDRVKVAIYKLQPLTAKMNAIYRKSVTSNTRDIVMDNHKGTYSKRYPPGDYDDSYDRTQPGEFLIGNNNRQQTQRSSSGPTLSVSTTSTTTTTPSSVNLVATTQEPQQASMVQVEQNLEQQQSVPQVGAEIEASESDGSSAIYLPAPREILELAAANATKRQITSLEVDEFKAGESKIVATGIGRRLGDGRVARDQVSLTTTGERLNFMDELSEQRREDRNDNSSLEVPSLFPPELRALEDVEGPLFGYRITIYRAPASEATNGSDTDQFTYRLDGIGPAEMDEDEPTTIRSSGSEFSMRSSATELANDSSRAHEEIFLPNEEDTMVTSESSLIATQQLATDKLLTAPSAESQAQKVDWNNEKELEAAKKSDKEKNDDKRREKQKKSLSKKRRDELESKRKREYKKIKHNKGIVSKEKKTMHRDKHVKAHDRGAAKEKALKERTQIEFFEREQIVDDEFEKGKKSSSKGNWQSGQDSRKSLKMGDLDNISSGGSHYVKHDSPKEDHNMKGTGLGAEVSSGKKSTQFEKKQMEAKGKKFKGWREKGYKIITETEFIDRGSLHDSAYKKRDKGAAQHQKYKKQEASSEGHHGSMLEHHKKLNKKEEKKSKHKEEKEFKNSEEAKKEQKRRLKNDKKGAGEASGKVSKVNLPSVGEDDDDNDHDASSTRTPNYEFEQQHQHINKSSRLRNGQQPGILSASSTTFRPVLVQHEPAPSLMRLINANHHHDNLKENNNSTTKMPELVMARYHLLLNDTSGENLRRADGPALSVGRPASSLPPPKPLGNASIHHNNNTVLDIVDNLTGRQFNKTKIGTYDLEDHHTLRVNNSLSPAATSRTVNSLANYFSFLTSKSNPLANRTFSTQTTSTPSITTTTSTTKAPPPPPPPSTPYVNPAAYKQDQSKLHSSNDLNLNHNYNNHKLNNHNTMLLNVGQQSRNYPANHQQQPFKQSSSSSHHRATSGIGNGGDDVITPEQADAAAQLLRIVQSANQQQQPAPTRQQQQQPQYQPQPPNLLDLASLTINNAHTSPVSHLQRPAFLVPPPPSWQQFAHLNLGLNHRSSFEPFDQYDHDMSLNHHVVQHPRHNFLAD